MLVGGNDSDRIQHLRVSCSTALAGSVITSCCFADREMGAQRSAAIHLRSHTAQRWNILLTLCWPDAN